MERQLYTVPEDAALADVLHIMLEHRVKRIVVTDAQGQLVGMVDRAALLDTISLALQDG